MGQIFKAAFFDLDGTLLDTLKDLASSMNETLEIQGFHSHPLEAYRYFVGEGIEELCRRALPEHRAENPEILASTLRLMKEIYHRRCHENTRPYPGIPQVLKSLIKKKIPLSVITNKPHEFALKTVEHYFSGISFAAVRGENAENHRKPDPAAALKTAAQLGVSPHEVFYLGDTAIDMQTARKAGFFAAGALWGFRESDELKGAGAEILLNRPEEILDFFQE